jgi:S1-C subfamily serine protease
MRGFLVFGALVGLCGQSGAGWAEVNHAVSLSVVQIRAYPGSGKTAFGSGVVIGANQVVTNCHVTRYAHRIVVAKGAAQHSAISQKADPRHDLCLLTAAEMAFPTARIGTSRQLKVGEPLYFYGYPRGLGLSFSQGEVEALHPFEGGRVIETSASFTLGGSGGGLFDDQGELVGLATFLSAGRSGRHYAIPSEWISSVSARASRRIEPFSGQSFWEDPGALPGFLKHYAR